MNLAHLHLLLNHFPTVGMIIGLGVFLVALIRNNVEMKQLSLVIFTGIAIIALPTYMTGNAAQEMIIDRDDISLDIIEAHQSQALLAFLLMEIVGALSWLGLWQYRRDAKLAPWLVPAVLVLGLITFGLMANAASIGGEIAHPEVRVEGVENSGIDMLRGSSLSATITNTPWIWPFAEVLHFMGMAMLFGIVLLLDLRVLGVMKGIRFQSVHRLLPWAVVAFSVNTATGMLFFIGAPEQYTTNPVFHWKVGLILVASINALYFTIFDEPWTIQEHEEAPMRVKWVAASALVIWVGVIYAGRMLPFIGNAF